MNWRKTWWVLVPFLVLAGSRIGANDLLGYHHFRQAHTALTARGFATTQASILQPAIDGVTYGRSLYINEFPLYAYLVGLLWRVFGEHLVLARLLSVCFALGAFWNYGRLVERLTGDRLVATVSVAALSLCPVIAYFARSVQRQSLFLFVLLAGLTHAVDYMRRPRRLDLFVSGVSLALALLLNPFAVYLVLPLGWLVAREGRGALRRWPLAVAAALAVLPACAWYAYSMAAARHLDTGAIQAIADPVNRRDFLSPAHYTMWLDATNWGRAFRTLTRFVVPPASSMALCLFGLARAPAAGYRFFRLWAAAAAAYLLVDFYPAAVVVHHYYYNNLALPLLVFFAYALVSLGRAIARRAGLAPKPAEGGGLAWILSPAPRDALATAALSLCAVLYAAEGYGRTLGMLQDEWHSSYYAVRKELTGLIEPGKRVTAIAESNDPLFSYVFSPRTVHRLVHYRPERLRAVLAAADFDYLLVVGDTVRYPLEEIVRAIDEAGYLGRPVLQRPGILLYRPARPGAAGGGKQ